MKTRTLFLNFFIAMAATANAHDQSQEPAVALVQPPIEKPNVSPATESRDASLAFTGVANFVVGRVGRDCLSLVGRSDTPQAFVAAWQQRNMRYLAAARKYMNARFDEAMNSGGPEKRDILMQQLMSAVQHGAGSSIKLWLDHPDRLAACKRAISTVESGAYDFSPKTPIYAELNSLVAWAEGSERNF